MAKTTTNSTKKQTNTTVAIDPQTTERLNAFCLKCDITKKDFISMSLDFFDKTGLTPSDADKVVDMEYIKNRMEAIDNRTEQTNTITAQVQGMVMGQMSGSIKGLLQEIIIEREAAQQLLLEATEQREQMEQLKALAEAETNKKKRKWFGRK